jgi:hypothetical protein
LTWQEEIQPLAASKKPKGKIGHEQQYGRNAQLTGFSADLGGADMALGVEVWQDLIGTKSGLYLDGLK